MFAPFYRTRRPRVRLQSDQSGQLTDRPMHAHNWRGNYWANGGRQIGAIRASSCMDTSECVAVDRKVQRRMEGRYEVS